MPATGETWNQFELFEPLGTGGMGQVFLAKDRDLDRKVALKFLPEKYVGDAAAHERFLREAKSAAALDHPYICKIFETGEAGGQAFIAMEYVEGKTLQEKVAAGPLRLPDLLEIGAEIGEAVAAAHKKGIVHRDLKSPNIMVTLDGHVKVLDFGLAKRIELDGAAGRETSSEVLTAHDQTPGTVVCMSPEQVRGEPIDARTDIFSLGVVLYEMATGRLPFQGATSGATYDAILNRQPPAPRSLNPELPEDLERIVLKALEKDREHRYQTTQELVVDLRRLKRGTAESAPPYLIGSSAAQTVLPRRSGRRWLLGAVLGALAMAVGWLGWSNLRSPSSGGAIDSLAVLPFENVRSDPVVDYLADGIPESLINRLSAIPQLQVMARSTAFRYRGQNVDPRIAGADLGVGAVLTGRLVQQDEVLNVQTELVDVASGGQLWGEQYRRELSDLLVVQNDIAREISDALRLELSGEERDQLTLSATENSEAYRAYLKGRFFLNRRTQEDIEKAVMAFEQARTLDPDFALAHVGLGDSYIIIGAQWYGVDPDNPPETAMAKARAAAREALELDPSLAEAYVTRAYIRFLQDWDWESAERDFLRAIELKPNYVVAHQWYSEFLGAMGRHDEGIAESLRAVELDPTSPLQYRELANSYANAGRFREAIDTLETADELDPDHPATLDQAARAYWASGMHAAAIEAASREDERKGELYRLLSVGKNSELVALVESFEGNDVVNDQLRIFLLVFAGAHEKAIELLEACYRRRYVVLPATLSSAFIAPIRDDPRVIEIRHAMNLPP